MVGFLDMDNRPLQMKFVVKFPTADGSTDISVFSRRAEAEECLGYAPKGSVLKLHMVGSYQRVKLSPTQKAFLADFAREGRSIAPSYSVGASAWHRTRRSLERMGLVKRVSYCVAHLTWLGLAWAAECQKKS